MQRSADHGWEDIGLILLAGGRSTRFGRNKLAEPLLGIPLVRRTAEIYAGLPFARRIAVVCPALPSLGDLGYVEMPVANSHNPQSESLAEGVRQLGAEGLHGIMVGLGDMPLVTAAHLEQLLACFDGGRVVCSSAGPARCPPAIFPIAARAELTAQTGDRGARSLLASATCVQCDEDTLLDIDSKEDFSRAAAILSLTN